jgi:hypothetical protein
MALIWILFCCGISVLWGSLLERASPDGMIDFKGVFYGTRCLLQHGDPYKVGGPLHIYEAEAKDHSLPSTVLQQVLSLNVYLPTAFILITPFAMLPWGLAHLVWMALTAGCLLLASLLMWNVESKAAPLVSVVLICFLLSNCEAVIATGNPAGIVVGLCVVAVWCFLKGRFVPIGVLCLAISLAIKPHDAGLVWLYFVLAGGVYRKRALQTLLITIVLAVPAILWISHVAPYWMQELHSNLLAQAAPGGACDPGPSSANSGSGPSMIINLQSALYVFRNDPCFYNPASYLVCGALLLIALVGTLRLRFSQRRAWLALAAIVPITMLVTYHRPYDAKILLLSIPACAMLWAEGGLIAWIALLVNTLGIVSTADIPLTILLTYTKIMHITTVGLPGQIQTIVLTRPTPLILLAMGIFYLWLYVRHDPALAPTTKPAEPGKLPLFPRGPDPIHSGGDPLAG